VPTIEGEKMGLLSLFGGKSSEEIERIGDGYFKNEEFGAAKIEYEKALEKAQRKFPEKTELIKKLSEKIIQSKEALASFHLKTAQQLIASKIHKEAEGLLQLALELTENEKLKENILANLKPLTKERNIKPLEFTAHDTVPVTHSDEEREAKNIDEYFSILCETLPEDIQRQYHGYGRAFKEGYVALNSADFETAAEQLDKAMAENPSPHSLIPIELATALAHLKKFDEAAGILEQYIADNPEEARAYQALCEAYWDLGEFDKAIELLDSRPAGIKAGLPAVMLMGETLYLKGSYSDAANIFEKALAQFGFNEIIARSLAKSHEAMGNIQKARDLYGKIIKGCQSCGTRTDPFIKGRYADLCFESGDKSANLLELYFSLVQEDPDNKFQFYQRIWQIYEEMGNADLAKRYQAMAEAAAP